MPQIFEHMNSAESSSLALSSTMSKHRSFATLFKPGRLTFGLNTPIEGYPDSPAPTMANHAQVAQKADVLGIGALWLRDVPFYDPSFGDVGQILDPFVYAGWLAATTRNIAIGTAGIVLPLREPIYVAKQAASADQLLGGRMLLGLAAGDRPTEYPAFGSNHSNRAERYRDGVGVIDAVLGSNFPVHTSSHYGRLTGVLNLVPKPHGNVIPKIAIGRAGQPYPWLADNVDAWITSGLDIRRIVDLVPEWRQATAHHGFKPFGYGVMLDLLEDPNAPLEFGRVLIRGGRKEIITFWKGQERAGINHIALNLKPTRRPMMELLQELGEHVLPEFPLHVP